jgi:hypothetical protein
MDTHSVPQHSAQPEEDFRAIPESPLEGSFLNPILADGAKGGVGVARRRLGVLVTALLGGDEMHPMMSSESIRATMRDELCELDSILEAVEREMAREAKNVAAASGRADR